MEQKSAPNTIDDFDWFKPIVLKEGAEPPHYDISRWVKGDEKHGNRV